MEKSTMPRRICVSGMAALALLLPAAAIAQPAKGPAAGAPPAMPVKAVAARVSPCDR
jgi:hypothetical protein